MSVVLSAIAIYYYSIIDYQGKGKIQIINRPDLKSFNQIIGLHEFNGQVIFIDVWGTLCGPCIKEFNFDSELQTRFKNEPVTFLFLATSYDRADDKFRWKQMIQEKQLFGKHFLLTTELYYDFWNTIKDSINTMYQIPHYLIIGKNGKILIANAERPSSKEKLYGQIQWALKNSY